jgi:hypothetical protein
MKFSRSFNAAAEPVTTRIYPAGMLYTLSRHEVERLQDVSRGDLAGMVRRCSLAVLNSGNESDDAEALLEQYQDFSIEVQQVNRGLRIELNNAPGSAFVDGRMIEGIRELLSAVIRDLIYFDSEISGHPHHDLGSSAGITNAVFECPKSSPTWWSAGAGIRSAAANTNTPRTAVMNWACVT